MRNPSVIAFSLACAFVAPVLAQNNFLNYETPHVSPIAMTPSGGLLLACNTPDNRLEVFDISGPAGVPIRVRSIPVGLEPVSVRVRNENEAWVVNHLSDSISIIDLPTGRVVKTILTGDEPCDVVFAGSPQRAFVSISQQNQIRVYDASNVDAVPVVLAIEGATPKMLATDGTRVYAAIFESGNHSTVLPATVVSGALNPYAGRPNPPPNSGVDFVPAKAPGNPAAPAVSLIIKRVSPGNWRDDNNGNWSSAVTWDLHDHDVAIISNVDSPTPTLSYASGMMNINMALAVAPDGRVTVVGTDAINEKRFEPNVSGGRFLRVVMGSFNPATPSTVTVTDLNPHLIPYSSSSVPVATRNLSIGDPRAIAWHGASNQAYIAGMGSSNIVVTTSTGDPIARIPVAAGPTGLVMDAAGAHLYVLSKFAAQVSVINPATNTVTASVPMYDPTPAAIRNGRPFLYDTHLTSGLGHAACASCHVDGRIDQLAWDLGNPAGSVKTLNQSCNLGLATGCENWHPMKGPMTTQTLFGLTGTGSTPMHWRGDRENLAAFNPAFVSLMGADSQLSTPDMDSLTALVSSFVQGPNPNRNLNGSLKTSITTDGRTGNPVTGNNIYTTTTTDQGFFSCNTCHQLPTGSLSTLVSANLIQESQSMKVPQLRNMYRKAGLNKSSTNGNRGFGFIHDGSEQSLFTFLQNPIFTFPTGDQGRRDVESFVLSLDTQSHAAIGQQVTFNGVNNTDPALLTRVSTFLSLANSGTVGLIVKGRVGGFDRGYQYLGSNNYQSDRAAEQVSHAVLLASAATGSELTWTVVAVGSERRMGIDRDADGYFDRDEIDIGTNPADPASNASLRCNRADVASLGGTLGPDHQLTVDDIVSYLTAFFASNIPVADIASLGGGTTPDGQITVDDLVRFLALFFQGCS